MFDPDFIIIDETGPAQPKAALGPFADDAREALRQRLGELAKRALEWHEGVERHPLDEPPHSAIRITTGIGKSERIRRVVAWFIAEARRLKLPHRVLIAVPTHRLADEAQGKMPNGVTTAIWRGRDAMHPATNEPMCGDLAAVKAAIKIGAKIEKTVCKCKEARCPLYDNDCGYQAQKTPARKADVVFAAHEALFHAVPALGKGFGLVVADEAFWQDGVAEMSLAIAGLDHELKAFPVRYKGVSEVESYTNDLRDLIQRLQRALATMPDGYVTRQPLIDAGLKPKTLDQDSSCSVARKLEWARKVETGMSPGASNEDWERAVKQFGFIGQLPRRAAMWRALDDLIAGDDDATGRLLLTRTAEDGTVRWLRVQRRKDIVAKFAGLPIILADATLPLELVQHYLPNLQLALDLNVAAPHMRITQAVGLPVGKASLQALPAGKRSDDEEERVARKRQRLVDAVRHLVAGRRGLVITYKDIENDFKGIEGVDVAHFGAIEGIDKWRDVDVLVTIGRPLPRPQAIEHLAAAITSKPVIAGPMVQQDRTIRPSHVLTCRVYAAPEAEMIRSAVTEAAIVQAVGRVRGVNRTEANPVEVFVILSDVVVPGLPMDKVVEFQKLEPDAIDHMIARGLILQMPTDAAKLHPDLFSGSRNTAKQAYHRAGLRMEFGPQGLRLVTSSYRYIFIRECNQSPFVGFRFQPIGRGQLPRFCMADPVKVPDVRGTLEGALGPLARFEVLS